MYASEMFDSIKDILSTDPNDPSTIGYQIQTVVDVNCLGDDIEYETTEGNKETVEVIPRVRVGDMKDTSLGIKLDFEHPATGEILKEQKFMLLLKEYPSERSYKQMLVDFYAMHGTDSQIIQMLFGGFMMNDIQAEMCKINKKFDQEFEDLTSEISKALHFYDVNYNNI